ncbi:tyrosine-type recombinase/integrase [Pseudonocardia hispaniensis]|uniref:Tyrosine-type recombinase/integrase n=1 Tax=Pseudonocardia hispaniensis TaxID=904933 RepID=A0ABW1J3F8_9PSEU
MRQLVLPVFEHDALREITVGRVDRFLKALAAGKSYSTAKQAKTVLSLAFGLAVRYDALRENPVRDTAKLHKPPSQAKALTIEDIEVIRQAARNGVGRRASPVHRRTVSWSRSSRCCSARRLASARCSRSGSAMSDVTVSPATVRICGTIVSPKGKPTHRQHHPKTQKSTRTVSVPPFVAEVPCQRLVLIAEEDSEHLIFFSRNHTPLTTDNIRRRLRAVLEDVEIEGVTPHSFRRTVATFLDRASGPDLAAEMLGHSSTKITKEHYIQPDERVDPVTADILEALAPRREVPTMPSDHEEAAEDQAEITALPARNEMHYDSRVFERVDWSKRGEYMQRKHGITPQVADDALGDPNRIVIDPDYNSTSGESVRIIGFSTIADDIVAVIVLQHEGTEYGVNGWSANEKDRRIYNEGSYAGEEGEAP